MIIVKSKIFDIQTPGQPLWFFSALAASYYGFDDSIMDLLYGEINEFFESTTDYENNNRPWDVQYIDHIISGADEDNAYVHVSSKLYPQPTIESVVIN
jgi:hypothetical protein